MAIALGLVLVLAAGFLGVPGLGIFTQDQALVMVGGALAVLSFGLLGSLMVARRALRTVEQYASAMAAQTARHAEELAQAAQITAMRQAQTLEDLANLESRQAAEIASMQSDEKTLRAEVATIRTKETALEKQLDMDRQTLDQEIEALRGEEMMLASRVEEDEKRAKREVADLVEAEEDLESRFARTNRTATKAVNKIEGERERLERSVQKVMKEERERKEEFEALAAEEIRLMGRVRRTEQAVHAGAQDSDENYRISRPARTTKGPFGEIYPVSQVEGISKPRAQRLRAFGISNTEHLWRANPQFIAKVLHCDASAVKDWQREAELMAIHGIGPERARVLVESGVTSVKELAHQKPKDLVTLVHKGHRNAAGVTPANAEEWITEAQKLG